MGGKGKSKKSNASATIDLDDKVAARAKLRREIQQTRAELAADKSDTLHRRRRDEADRYDEADRWGKHDEWDHWGEYDESYRWGKRWGKYDRADGWGKGNDTERWDRYEGGYNHQAWKEEYNYKSRTTSKGSSGNKGRFDDREKGSTKGPSFTRESESQSEGKGKSKDSHKAESKEHNSTRVNVQDLEKKLADTSDVHKAKASSITAPIESKGAFCEVRKHTDMGCAVVVMETATDRDAILDLGKRNLNEKGRPVIEIIGVSADMRPHTEGSTSIFVAWGHGKEKQTPLSSIAIAETFDNLYREVKGLPLATVSQPVVDAAKAQPSMRQEPVQSGTSGPPAMLPQMGQAQIAQAPVAQQQMALLAQRQMMLQQMALAGQRPAVPQQNMQQMAAAFAAAAQATAQALNMPNNLGNTGVAAGFPATTPTLNAALAQQQQQQAFMRAEAPNFTPAVGQQNPWQQQFQQAGQQSFGSTATWYSNNSQSESSAYGQQPPERRPLQIVDPQSGKAIETPAVALSPSAFDYLDMKPPTRKALTIVDPSSGKTVDTLAAVNFKPAEGKKPLSIIDPSSGSTVKI